MAGGLNFPIIQEAVAVAVVAVAVVAVVVNVVVEVLTWNVTSVVSLVILLVNAVYVLVLEDLAVVVVAVELPPDIVGAQVMGEGNYYILWIPPVAVMI